MAPRVTHILIAACSITYLFSVAGSTIPPWLFSLAGLTGDSFFSGNFWTPFSYFLLHDNTRVLSFVAHMLSLFYFGRIVEARLGRTSFLKLVALVVVLPGLFYVVFEPIIMQRSLLESTPLAIGLLTAVAILEPNRPLQFLLVALPMRIVLLIVILALAFLQIGFYISITAHLSYMSALFIALIYTRAWSRKHSIYTRGYNPYRRF